MKHPFSPFVQNLIYAGILAVVGLGFYSLRPVPTLLPRGIFLPSNVTSDTPVHPADVELIETLPSEDKILGRISIFRHFDSLNPEEIDEILSEEKTLAQSLAADHGGHQMLITAGQTLGGASPLDGIIMNALVVK